MRNLPYPCFLLAALAAACVDSEPTAEPDPGAVDDDQAMAGVTDNDLAPGEQEVQLPVVEEAARPDTYHRLLSTAFNLEIFQRACYDTSLQMGWNCPDHWDGDHARFTYKRPEPVNDVEVADNHGYYWGQCVSLVKAAAKNDTLTQDWLPGAGVFANLAPGTTIATFPGGHYYGHAAIFLAYVKNSSGTVVGIRVADQNWGRMVVKRHVIYKGTGGSVANANNFHAILVP